MTDCVQGLRDQATLGRRDGWIAAAAFFDECADEIVRLRSALETIAESHDAGRHDGKPEPCPAHDPYVMWALANEALHGTPDERDPENQETAES